MTNLLPRAGAAFIRALHAMLRVRHVRAHHIDRLNEAGKQYIIAFWHAHLILMLHSRYKRPITVLISQSRDGEIIARVFDHYDVTSTRGSATRGGMAAMRELIRVARNGQNIVFTPDGPKGPPRVAKDGVVYAAQATGLPIIPIAFAAKKKMLLRSWDRMVVPYPFSRAIFLYGEPIEVPRDGDVEEWRLRVERALNEASNEAEENFDELWQRDEG